MLSPLTQAFLDNHSIYPITNPRKSKPLLFAKAISSWALARPEGHGVRKMVYAVSQRSEELHWHEVRASKSNRNNTGLTNASGVLISIAYMELYLTLANFFGSFEMTLFETDEKSMEWRDHSTAVNASHVKVKAKPLATWVRRRSREGSIARHIPSSRSKLLVVLFPSFLYAA